MKSSRAEDNSGRLPVVFLLLSLWVFPAIGSEPGRAADSRLPLPRDEAGLSEPGRLGPFGPADLDGQAVRVDPCQVLVLEPGTYRLASLVVWKGAILLQGATTLILEGPPVWIDDPYQYHTDHYTFVLLGLIGCDHWFDPSENYGAGGAYPGGGGGSGRAGDDGYALEVEVQGNMMFGGAIYLDGEHGGGGGMGAEGYSGSFWEPAKPGVNGQSGGVGGNAGPGAPGGDGGSLQLTVFGNLDVGFLSDYCPNVDLPYTGSHDIHLDGGWGGDGGFPGDGGVGQSGFPGKVYDNGSYDSPTNHGANGSAGGPALGAGAGQGGTCSIWAENIEGLRISASAGNSGGGSGGGNGADGRSCNCLWIGGTGHCNQDTAGGTASLGLPGVPGPAGGTVTLHADCDLYAVVTANGGRGGDGGYAGTNGDNPDGCQQHPDPVGLDGSHGAYGGSGGNIWLSARSLGGSFTAKGGSGGWGGNGSPGTPGGHGAAAGRGATGGTVVYQAEIAQIQTFVDGGAGGQGGHGYPENGQDGSAGSPGTVTRRPSPTDNLQLQLSVDRPKAPPESRIRYTLSLWCTDVAQSNVVVHLPVPADTLFQSADPEAYPSGGEIVWHFDQLPPCQLQRLSLWVTIAEDAPLFSHLINQATAWSDQEPSDHDSGLVDTEVVSSEALELRLQDNPDPVPPGRELAYEIEVYTPTAFDLAGAILEVDIPAHTTFVDAGGTTATPGPTGTLTWHLGTLLSQTSAYRHLTVRVEEGLPEGSNTIQLQARAYVLTGEGRQRYAVQVPEYTSIGDYGILWLDPVGNPLNPGNHQVVRGMISKKDDGVQPHEVTVDLRLYVPFYTDLVTGEESSEEVLEWTRTGIPVASDWTFQTEVPVFTLSNRVEGSVRLNGESVGTSSTRMRGEFFFWYFKLRQGQSYFAQASVDWTSLDETTAAKYTEAAYRAWLMDKITTLAGNFADEAFDALAAAVGDYASIYQIILKGVTSGASAVTRKLDPDLAEDVGQFLQRHQDRLNKLAQPGVDRMQQALDSAPQNKLAGQAAKYYKSTLVDDAGKPITIGEAYMGTANSVFEQARYANDNTFLDLITQLQLMYVDALKQSLAAVGSRLQEFSSTACYQVLADLVNAPEESLPGDRGGARLKAQEALQKIDQTRTTWHARLAYWTGLVTKGLGDSLNDAGAATSGIGLLSANPIFITAGKLEQASGEVVSKVSQASRAVYAFDLYNNIFQCMLNGHLETAYGGSRDFNFTVAGPAFTQRRADLPEVQPPGLADLRSALLELQRAAKTNSQLIPPGDRLGEAVDRLLETEPLFSARLQQAVLDSPWREETGLEQYGLGRGTAAQWNGLYLRLQGIVTLLVGLVTDPADPDLRRELLAALDHELALGLPEVAAAQAEAKVYLDRLGYVSGGLALGNIDMPHPLAAGTENRIGVTLLNGGDEPVDEVALRLVAKWPMSVNGDSAAIGTMAPRSAQRVEFDVTGEIGPHPYDLCVTVSKAGAPLISQTIGCQVLESPVTQTFQAAGSLSTSQGSATLSVGAPAAGQSVTVRLAPLDLPFGPGTGYTLAGYCAYSLSAAPGALPAGSVLSLQLPSPLPDGVGSAGLDVYSLSEAGWEPRYGFYEESQGRITLGTPSPGVLAVLAPAGGTVAPPLVEESNGAVELSWGASAAREGRQDSRFRIYRYGPVGGGAYAWIQLGETTATGWRDDSVLNGVSYLYRVVPLKADGSEETAVRPRRALPHSSLDFDQDGLPDEWERAFGLDPDSDDAAEDPDGDGLTNLEEYQARQSGSRQGHAPATDPHQADSDLGGLNDGEELRRGLDPLWPDDDPRPRLRPRVIG